MFGTVSKRFDQKDLREVYELYFEPLRNFLYYKVGEVELAEDMVQETFVKVWQKRAEVRKDTVKSLLYTIANNLVINHFNHLKVVYAHGESVSEDDHKEHVTPEFIFEEKEFEKKFNHILSLLPEGSREVFLMNRIDQLKYAEIAERMNISVKAIEKRMSKALAILREELGRKI